MLRITHPIESGIVKNWKDMEKIWRFGFDKLGIKECSDHNVLVTEAVL